MERSRGVSLASSVAKAVVVRISGIALRATEDVLGCRCPWSGLALGFWPGSRPAPKSIAGKVTEYGGPRRVHTFPYLANPPLQALAWTRPGVNTSLQGNGQTTRLSGRRQAKLLVLSVPTVEEQEEESKKQTESSPLHGSLFFLSWQGYKQAGGDRTRTRWDPSHDCIQPGLGLDFLARGKIAGYGSLVSFSGHSEDH